MHHQQHDLWGTPTSGRTQTSQDLRGEIGFIKGKEQSPRNKGPGENGRNDSQHLRFLHPAAMRPITRADSASSSSSRSTPLLPQGAAHIKQNHLPSSLHSSSNDSSTLMERHRMGQYFPPKMPQTLVPRNFGAQSAREMREYAGQLRHMHGDVVLALGGGGYERMPVEGTPEWENFQRDGLRAAARLERYLGSEANRDHTLNYFRAIDAAGMGSVSKEALGGFCVTPPLRFSQTEATYIMAQAQMLRGGRFFYEEYLTIAVKKATEKETLARKAARGRHHHHHHQNEEGDGEKFQTARDPQRIQRFALNTLPLLVLILGFLFPPLWCLGWRWARSTVRSNRILGILSLALFVIVVSAAVPPITLAILAIIKKPTSSLSHCPQISGVWVQIEVGGGCATEDYFWSIAAQNNFRLAVYDVYKAYISKVPTELDLAVQIDSISALTTATDNQGVTLTIIFKVLYSDQAFAVDAITSAVENGAMLAAFQTRNICFNRLFLAKPKYNGQGLQRNPGAFSQSQAIYVPSSSTWAVLSSTGLSRQPPTGTLSNIMDFANDPGWAMFRDPAMPTCWYLSEILVAGLTGVTTATRRVEIDVRLNTTEVSDTASLIQVMVRKDSNNVPPSTTASFLALDLNSVRSPRWLLDTDNGATEAKGVVENPETCGVAGCYYTYQYSYSVGPYQHIFWVGVLGRSAASLYIPFTVSVRVVNT
mmetsp:Transcript_32970/g.87484  ORF Transcript_32970/g.87484 Transcript_32970/m.87484 type:complete len:706 (-) Transcript_32970:610-2727(-)